MIEPFFLEGETILKKRLALYCQILKKIKDFLKTKQDIYDRIIKSRQI